MEIQIIAVGDIKENYLAAAINEYKKRLSKYTKVKITEIKEERMPKNPSAKEIEQALEKEGEKILDIIEPRDFTYVMAIEGKQMSSPAFAKEIRNRQVQGFSRFNFIIGSSHGLSKAVKKEGIKFSFSKMTFPHQLMRVILLEQIYRAFKINNHEEYHK